MVKTIFPRAALRFAAIDHGNAPSDPRFDPVRLDEVSALTIKVQLLEPPEAS